jgi:signal transduction histidine kinase
MFPDLFPFLQRPVQQAKFERSVFALVAQHVTDKKALGEELLGTKTLEKFPVSENQKRQKMAVELYLLLERNISEEQTKNRIPPEMLRERIVNRCHPERAEGNFALFFLPHYERQIKLFERFATIAFERARDLMGKEGFTAFMKFLAADPLLQSIVKNEAIQWGEIAKQTKQFPPAVRRDTIQNLLKRAFRALAAHMSELIGEIRTELMFQDIYQRFRDPIDFIEDAAKVLLLVPDNFLTEERIGLMGKAELEKQLRLKNKALETTLAEVQGEKLKLSTLSREELEKKVQERTAELVSALTAAELARKNLEEFSSLATHELRTPIAAVKGYLNLIASDKAGNLTDPQKKYLHEVTHANDRLLTLVNAMLDVSRIELGTLAIEPAPASLTKIADGVLAELAPKIKEKGQVLLKKYDEAIPDPVQLDSSLTHAIFINILSNAVKYTAEKGTITLTIQKRESDILITVADTGCGIPKAQQARIFEKLFRADNVRVKIPEGTGLGLYLVKSILEQTNGKIWFESEEDKGTTFFVTIPIAGMSPRQGTRGLS